MKSILTAFAILIAVITYGQEKTIKLLDSKYYYESAESKTDFKRLILLEGKTYYVEGYILFDDEGQTIQKIEKFEEGVKENKIEDGGYTSMLADYDKMAFIQFKNAEENKDKITAIIARLDEELMKAGVATSNDYNFDNGVCIAEYFLQDSDAAFQKIYDVLKDAGMIDNILLGQRVYMDGDDYNIEVFYPLDYEGKFWGF